MPSSQMYTGPLPNRCAIDSATSELDDLNNDVAGAAYKDG